MHKHFVPLQLQKMKAEEEKTRGKGKGKLNQIILAKWEKEQYFPRRN